MALPDDYEQVGAVQAQSMSTLQTKCFKMRRKALLLNDLCQIWPLDGCLLPQI